MKSFKKFLAEQDAPQLGRVVIVKDYDNEIPSSEADREDFEQFVMQTGKYAKKDEPVSDNTMSQSEVDDEGKPTGLVKVTPKKLKVYRVDGPGPIIPPAPKEKTIPELGKKKLTTSDYSNSFNSNIFDGRGRANYDEYGQIVSYGIRPSPKRK